jgi:23S rRNA pseudouridine2605 synthase
MVAADGSIPGTPIAEHGERETRGAERRSGGALMRLAKHLAHAGVASRRAAESLIAEGRVSVDGETVRDPARDVGEDNRILVDGRAIEGPEPRLTYAVHKPVGVVSTAQDTHGRPTVVGLVPDHGLRLYPVGRLDADTTGLILLTNDGDLAYALTHPSFEVPRTYRARVEGRPDERALRALRLGVELEDGRTAPARVRRVGPHEIELTIHEGRKRQIKRMCDAVGHPIVALKRVAFGPLRLGELAAGRHRRLTAAEVERLRESARRGA